MCGRGLKRCGVRGLVVSRAGSRYEIPELEREALRMFMRARVADTRADAARWLAEGWAVIMRADSVSRLVRRVKLLGVEDGELLLGRLAWEQNGKAKRNKKVQDYSCAAC
jgi:hypothetical protein